MVQIYIFCSSREAVVKGFNPRGGGLLYKKDGLFVENFENNPQQVTRSCFVGVDAPGIEICFHP